MRILQCIFCKKPFQSYGSKICPGCLQQMDECFIKVRDYLDEHPYADMDTVAKETEVSSKIILHLLKEGRLIIGNDETGNPILTCESCKKPVSTGRLCEPCKGKISKVMGETVGGGASKPLAPKKASEKNIKDRKGVAKIDS